MRHSCLLVHVIPSFFRIFSLPRLPVNHTHTKPNLQRLPTFPITCTLEKTTTRELNGGNNTELYTKHSSTNIFAPNGYCLHLLVQYLLKMSHQFVTASSTGCALLVEHPMERFSPCPGRSAFEECFIIPVWASIEA